MKPTRCTLALKYTKSAPLEGGGGSKGGGGSTRARTAAHPKGKPKGKLVLSCNWVIHSNIRRRASHRVPTRVPLVLHGVAKC